MREPTNGRIVHPTSEGAIIYSTFLTQFCLRTHPVLVLRAMSWWSWS